MPLRFLNITEIFSRGSQNEIRHIRNGRSSCRFCPGLSRLTPETTEEEEERTDCRNRFQGNVTR